MLMQRFMRLIDCVLDTPVTEISIPGADLNEVSKLLLDRCAFLFDMCGDLRSELRVVVVGIP